MDTLVKLDTFLLDVFSQSPSNHFLDLFFQYATSLYVWVPLMLVIFAFFAKQDLKQAVSFFITMLIIVGLCEVVVEFVLLDLFHRPGPCGTIETMKFPAGCVPENSFPSHIAADTFSFLIVSFFFYYRYWFYTFAVVLLVNWGTVYNGSVYPLDAFGGMLLGLFVGMILSTLLYNLIFNGLFAPKKKTVY